MADQKPTTNNYRMLGGVNLKSSEYSLTKAQFLDIRNMDFDVPNSLQKRPGSTQAVAAGTSGPITSAFEFVRLNGASWVVAGSDTAMFYVASGGLTLLDAGWNNGQPADMLTFVDKLWLANGQNFKSWNGTNVYPAGMPCPRYDNRIRTDGGGATSFLAASAQISNSGSSWVTVAIYTAYSYVRGDSYIGPVDFLIHARNIVGAARPPANGNDLFTYGTTASVLSGFTTVPGASAVAIWAAFDSIGVGSSLTETIPGVGMRRVGNLGFLAATTSPFFMGETLKPSADLSRFHLFTIVPTANLFTLAVGATSFWSTTFIPNHQEFLDVATGSAAFNGTPFCWFDSNTPKYIDVSQNVMISSGFSNAPSVVWVHDVGSPEEIQPENNFEVRTNDGDRIYGVASYTGQRLLFKEGSFHKLIGDSPENYELVELSTQIGCISQRTVLEWKEKLCWLDRKGVILYNGASWDYISDPVEDIFRRMNLEAAREHACGVNHIYRNQLWFGIPIDGSTQNNFTVVYDYLVDAWTFFEGFNPASFGFIKSTGTKPTVWRGDYSGLLHFHGESFFGDNGQGITCIGVPNWEKQKENETWIYRRFFLDVATSQGLTGTINVRAFADYDRSTVLHTATIYQNVFQSRAEMGVVAKAVTAEFAHFSASLPLLTNGYSWTRRYLRNV